MFNPSRGGGQTGRGGVQQRRDGSRPGQRQESGSLNQGRGRGGDRGEGRGRGSGGGRGEGGGSGGGRGEGGGSGGGRGEGRGRGGGRGEGRGRGGGRGEGRGRGGGRGEGRGRGGGRGEGRGGEGDWRGRAPRSEEDRSNQQTSGNTNGQRERYQSGTRNSARGSEQGIRSRSVGGRGRGDRRGDHYQGHHQGRTTRNAFLGIVTTGSQQSNIPLGLIPPPQNQQASGDQTGLRVSPQGESQRGRGGHGRGRDGGPWVPRLGYKAFEVLLDKEASEVAITLSSSLGLKTLLDDKSMSNDLVQLVCQVLCKAFQSRNDRKIVLHLAGVVKNSGFFGYILARYVTGMMSENMPDRRQQYPQHLGKIISLLSDVLNMFPYSSVQSVSMLVTLLKPSVNQLRASGIDIPNSVDEHLESVQGLVDHLQEKSRDGTLRSDKYSFLAADEDAPPGEEDFRTMSIYPTPEEFHLDHNPFLRPNIITQKFPSSRIYLDTHFRLLREDFVRPLREGIRDILRSQHNENLKKKRFDDIRVYFDTRLVVPLCTPTGIAYTVQFDPRPLQFVRWENSKRLLYGSLVCLSMDNFESFLFAIVNDRDPKLLKEGKVDLCFSSESRVTLAKVEPSHSFLMVETTAYFEAYRYVLEGLQEQDEDDLPFQRYIVECNSDVHPPAYLQMEGKSYDLSNIVAEGQEKIPPFNPLIPEAWPDEEKLGLDESQRQALKLALTKELAIIQGPPGTGKTYVGLKIARALLDNHKAWSCGGPMLVVCYTNHALDQFLEGIHKFLKEGIVRVGGRSNSEILKRFSLRELTRAANFRRNLPLHLRRAHHEIYTQMKDAEERLKRQSAQLKCILSGVLKVDFLENQMSDEHWHSLHQQPMWDGFESVGKKSSIMDDWLGYGSSVFQQWSRQTKGAEAADEDGPQEPEEELLNIAEEADLIQAERILVDADYQDRNEHKKQSKKQNDEVVDAMAEFMLSMNLNDTESRPDQHESPADEEGWQMQKHQKKKIKQMVKHELMKSSVMSKEEERRVQNVWNLDLKDRWRLYRLWVLRYRTDLRSKALNAEQIFQEAAERLNEIRRREDLCVLRDARVIGMTTTGAAKYRQALQELKPRLVVVEEAAEVMEAHTITTLSRACKHLILIGDHQQLRPSATVYDLARNFNLEVSMFERLIKVGFPFVRLNYQHRMRPCIARLLTPHIYSELENHPSVLEYDNIKGLLTNLFFVDHRHLEEEIKDGRSHQNPHEARFVVALCRYFLCQGYKPSQITILTTYTGQLFCLRKHMPTPQFSGVKVHVVDKYQGEENDIIILSLVRSNLERRVGFLNISNRVCVALSRAKMGLYCIGNMDMLGTVKLWSNILHSLRETEQVGRALTLSCVNHPDKKALVSCADDFKSAPEGGCDQPCQYRLDCGHVCTRMCHPYDAEHKEYKCTKDCPKLLCELGHKCHKRCYQECGKCRVPIEKVIPSCQHTQKVPCYQDPVEFVCQEPCHKTLTCGHPCKAKCGDLCTARCMAKVPVQLKCGHTQNEPCFVSRDPKKEIQCRTKCGTTLKCGHPCPGTCHGCYQGRLHKECNHKCQQILVCSHKCREPCVRDCPPCSFKCENRCVHSVCMKTCGQLCTPCNEPCAWECPHQRCTKLCHEPCDRPPCSVPCSETLPCGHPCIGLCGDPCPDKCRICHPDEVTEIFFGSEDEQDAHFVQLEECKHLFETTGMDHYMSLDADQEADLDQLAIQLKSCPRCRTPIRRNLRYGTHINRSLAAIEMVKKKVSGLPAVIEKKQDDLNFELGRKTHLMQYLPEEFALVSKMLDVADISLQHLWELENLMDFLERFGKLVKMQKECMSPENSDVFARRIGECLKVLLHQSQKFSDQQVEDLERELKRLNHLAELNVRCHVARFKVLGVQLNTEIRQLREILEDTLPFSEGPELTVKQMFTELDTKLPQSGLNITDEEREMIVKAIGLNKGHWYKCPNGHVYAIGDCGGAMEESRCPECNATIGGANHALFQGNTLASEMDGAEHAAWSDGANLAIPLNF